jgi:hypothetical protein
MNHARPGAGFTHISLQEVCEGHSNCLETSNGRKIFSPKMVLNYVFPHDNLVPNLLYRLSCPECHMLLYYLCKLYVFY